MSKKTEFKFVTNPHISLKEKEICKKDNCGNVHLWFNKRFGIEQYQVSFSNLNYWDDGWCLAKEICVPENGIVKEITDKLKEPSRLSVEVSEELFKLIFKGHNKNWKLHLW